MWRTMAGGQAVTVALAVSGEMSDKDKGHGLSGPPVPDGRDR